MGLHDKQDGIARGARWDCKRSKMGLQDKQDGITR